MSTGLESVCDPRLVTQCAFDGRPEERFCHVVDREKDMAVQALEALLDELAVAVAHGVD